MNYKEALMRHQSVEQADVESQERLSRNLNSDQVDGQRSCVGRNSKLERHSNLNRLSNDDLLASLENQFTIERKTSHSILLHLKEISRRRLYAQRGFPNLREMLIQHFHQSETAANQRLKSLELMLAVPVVEERLISGDLNMSTIAMAQRQILREEKLTGQELSKEKKTEIVESITNKTMAKAEIELFKLLPETASHPATYERRVSEHATRLNLTVPNDVMEMLIRLKEIWAHVDPRMDHVEVIRRSLKMTLQKVDPVRKMARPQKKKTLKKDRLEVREQAQPPVQKQVEPSKPSTSKQTQTSTQEKAGAPEQDQNLDQKRPDQLAKHDQPANPQQNPTHSSTESVKHRGMKRPYYSKHLDRTLWQRAQFRCEYLDTKTGRRCDCRFGLQREHVIPLALGGANDISNMQLLCAAQEANHIAFNKLRACRFERIPPDSRYVALPTPK